jgi:FemAB-related protein (PEP-CTERM system-associated)
MAVAPRRRTPLPGELTAARTLDTAGLEVEAISPRALARGELGELTILDDDASLAHEPAVLEALAGAYHHRAELVVARSEGRIVGALPLVLVRSPLGSTYSSVAYLDRGGPIGTPAARRAVVAFAARRAIERGSVLELRSPVPVEIELEGAVVQVSRAKDRLVCPLPPSPDDVIRRLDAKTRNQLRKPLREGLRAETEPASEELVRSFHQVYARTMRDLGSPPHASAFFGALARVLGDRARVARVLDVHDRVLAAALLLDDRHGRTLLPWAASDRRADPLEPNTLLYYELLVDSVGRARRELDLGRSTRDGPAYRFKLRWGAEPRALYWTTISGSDSRHAPGGADKEGKLGLAVALWKRLPLPIARRLGPFVGRWVAS